MYEIQFIYVYNPSFTVYERYAGLYPSLGWKDIRFFSHGVSSLPITHPALVMMMWGLCWHMDLNVYICVYIITK
jgi:hypothetical protein